MPTVSVEGQQFKFPEGTPDEVIGESIRQHFGTQPVQQVAPVQQPAEQPISEAGQAILDLPGGPAVSEFAAAVSRGTINLLDFVGPDQINAALQIAGSETRVPTLGEQPAVQKATTGGFMDPGLARQAVRTAGEFVTPTGAVGGAVRTAAQRLPRVTKTLGQGVLQQAAATPAATELTGAALAGAGSEVGAEVGEAVGGERGEKIGRLAGGLGLAIAPAIIKESVKGLITQGAKSLLKESAPTIDGLKTAARGVFKEIDNLGITINSSSINRLSNQLAGLTRKEGFNQTIHPKVGAALKEFEAVKNSDQSLSQLDTLRRVAQGAAKSIEPDEARLGTLMTNRIDDFLDNLGRANFSSAFKKDVGAKYRDARQLWRRAKKGELIEESFNKAHLQASGFENGIRTQFRSILNNKKKARGFTSEELDAMKQVVKGGSLENMAKMIGRFGFSEGQASNMLMGSLGVAGGAAIGGPAGAVAVPLIGQLSRSFAQRLTQKGAEGADLIVRAGKDGLAITKAYMKITPPKQRDARELTELLLRPEINVGSLQRAAKAFKGKDRTLINDSVFLTNAIKATEEE